MSDDPKPDPIEDIRTGLGLLFRAARTGLEKIPTKDIEQAVTSGAREATRVLETVGKTIEREVFGHKGDATPPGPPAEDPPAHDPPDERKPPPPST